MQVVSPLLSAAAIGLLKAFCLPWDLVAPAMSVFFDHERNDALVDPDCVRLVVSSSVVPGGAIDNASTIIRADRMRLW